MPRPKKPAPTAVQVTPPASKTSHLFQTRKPAERGGVLTHERIAEHMDAFRKSGGTIEVLGTTRALLRIGQDTEAAPPPSPPATPAPRKSTR
jgi:hypothetical protein